MPPTGKLAVQEINALREWVLDGAAWAAGEKSPGTKAIVSGDSRHWSFRPIAEATPPPVRDQTWIRRPIDAFVLAQLEARGLTPATEASKLTLLRRAKFDLHGLPPSREEIQAFLEDDSPGAFSRLVDRLLASPRYGEKWGRHWLDVELSANSSGLDDDIKLPHVWRFRDYVIDAFNDDLPFDRFILEQVAGDLLAPDDPGGIHRRGIIASGFLAAGPKPLVQQDKFQLKYDVVDEQIDTLSKAFLGLTIACARCHDRKFDPISTRDYYSLASILASVENLDNIDELVSQVHFEPLVPHEQYEAYKKHRQKIESRESWVEGAVELAAYRHIVESSGPSLAEYMLAARRIYEEGASTEQATSETGLDRKEVEEWVSYLRPGNVLRLYLEPWYKALPEEAPSLAESYEKRFLERGRTEISVLECWLEEAAEAIRSDRELPERDRFVASDDRLFAEVAFRAEEMGEGAADIDGPFSVAAESRDGLLDDETKSTVERMRREIEKFKEEAPPEPEMAYAVKEGTSVEQQVFLRGSYRNLGELVDKGFPAVLAGRTPPVITEGSGRVELARWLTAPDRPLTVRVAVNRIWLWHFSDGLVRTPNNFGTRGQEPTHPGLLDFLARRFIDDGWSIKSLHRLIMNSSVYRTSGDVTEEAWIADPGNRLWSRFSRRRLTAEEMRDSMLALDGTLDLTAGGRVSENLDSYGAEEAFFHPDRTRRRTVYLPLHRNKLPPDLTLFDFANSTTSLAQRTRSTIAPQGLYLMNSDFVDSRSRALASRLLSNATATNRARIEDAYWTAFARPATEWEINRMLGFISNYPSDTSDARLEAWASLCRVLLASNEFHHVD